MTIGILVGQQYSKDTSFWHINLVILFSGLATNTED